MTRPGEDRALTGLRGVAALLVCVHHLVLHLGAPPSPARAFALRGYLMVDLFFVLSGFVMALAYEGWFAEGFRPEIYLRFLWRRFARLWPLHACLVAAIVAVRVATGDGLLWWRMVVANLLMVQAWGLSQTLNVPSWSLSTECAAYALFPALSWMVLRGGRQRAAATAAVAGAVLVLVAQLGALEPVWRRGPLDIYGNYSVLPLLRCLAGFTLGLAARRAMRLAPLEARLRSPIWAAAAAGGLAVGLAMGAPEWLAYPLLVALVASLWAGQGGLSRLLALPVPHALGVWSYALYLVHMPLIQLWQSAGWPPPSLLTGAGLLGLSLAAAAALNRTVEAPARRALRRLEPGRAPAPGVQPLRG